MIISKNKAFLLIEVLVTVAIVAASIIFINHAFSSSLKAVSLSNSYREAILFLENQVFDIEFKLYTEKEAVGSPGGKEVTDRGFLWKSSVMPLEGQDSAYEYEGVELMIERLECLLSWQARGAEREIGFVTYVPVIENEEE